MKATRILFLALALLIVTSCARPSQMTVIPTPTWTVGKSDISWAEVDFKSITPKGIQLDQCWNGMGMDNQGRIYIGFTSRLADKETEDFVIFRYDPASGKKEFLGTFIDIAKAANNYQEGEEIPKGHTRMIYADGKMYMTSQSFHDLKWQIDSLPLYRGWKGGICRKTCAGDLDLRDNENVHFAHFGGTRDPVFHFVDNLWSGHVHLFILHVPMED